jgi:serine protease Do
MQLSFAPVVARVAPAVVNVYARSVVRAPAFNDPFFNRFFGGRMRDRVSQSLGSGVIVRADGIILTNNHVVARAQDIKIALADRREFSARVIQADPRTDLAVLKIDTRGERLPALEFGDSDRVQVGDLVLAIGDPFGVGQTVTSGIVSALARTRVGANDYQFFIQTDAAINPGNSGGPLVTLDGRIIGINTAIVSSSGGSVGVGFAIPSNMARMVLEGALAGGIRRPWLGARGQAVTAAMAAALGLRRPQGVAITATYPGGPAAQAGIARGDVILSVDGTAIDDPAGLNYRLASHRVGETARLSVLRNGRTISVVVRIAAPPRGPRDTTIVRERNPMQGATVATLSPALADQMQLDMFTRGVVVTQVEPGTIAARYGFQPGDIVRLVNDTRTDTVTQLTAALRSGQGWRMAVQRGERILRLRVN